MNDRGEELIRYRLSRAEETLEEARLLEDLEMVPAAYFKKLNGTDEIWEYRIQYGSNIYRIFCFFDSHSVVILTHGFEKKSMKTPRQEIERAETYRRDYLNRKGKRNQRLTMHFVGHFSMAASQETPVFV